MQNRCLTICATTQDPDLSHTYWVPLVQILEADQVISSLSRWCLGPNFSFGPLLHFTDKMKLAPLFLGLPDFLSWEGLLKSSMFLIHRHFQSQALVPGSQTLSVVCVAVTFYLCLTHLLFLLLISYFFFALPDPLRCNMPVFLSFFDSKWFQWLVYEILFWPRVMKVFFFLTF